VTILDALRAGTAPQHEHLEAMLALDADSLSAVRYASVVRAFRALYAPLERALDLALGVDDPAGWRRPEFDLAARRKLPRLDRDLAALSLGTPPDAPAAALPALADVPTALGALYVVEGATLGGRVIARRLASLGISPATGGAFFDGYGAATGAMRNGYRAQVTDYVQRFGDADRVVAGAVATFDAFIRWFAADPSATVPLATGAARG